MTTKTKTNAPSAADAARDHLEKVKEQASILSAELEDLKAEHLSLSAENEAGSLSVDYERLAELRDILIPRREERLEDIHTRLIPAAEQRVKVEEMSRWADMTAQSSIPAQRKRLSAELDEATATITAAITKAQEAVEHWNGLVLPVIAEAKAAGLVTGKCDPLSRVQAIVPEQERYVWGQVPAPEKLIVDGSEYGAFSVEATISDSIATAREGSK